MARLERLSLPDAELSRPALVLAQRFVQRWDLYACQLDDGRYICVYELLNVGHLFAHLRGETTLGTCLLDQESKATTTRALGSMTRATTDTCAVWRRE